MNSAINNVEKQANTIATLQAITNPIMETLAGLAIAGIICFSGYLATKRAGVQGEFMSFIVALLLAYEPAKRLANVRVKIEAGLVNIRTMFEVLDHPLVVIEHENAKDLDKIQGSIRFEDVSFAYADEKMVLKNINLEIEPQKMTALVGPSGSGKSTLINLIMRLYDPTKGRILINDQDIRYTTFRSLRKLMAYVGQDTFLFREPLNIISGLAEKVLVTMILLKQQKQPILMILLWNCQMAMIHKLVIMVVIFQVDRNNDLLSLEQCFMIVKFSFLMKQQAH